MHMFEPSAAMTLEPVEDVLSSIENTATTKEANAFEMFDLADLTDNLSVASIGEAASNSSESRNSSTDLLKLDTKGCIGFFERLPLGVKIILLVCFSVIGLTAVSAITVALSSQSLSTAVTASEFISQVKQITVVFSAVQQERKAGSMMLSNTTNYAYQIQYLQRISDTDSLMTPFMAMLQSNAAYSDLYQQFKTRREAMSELRAKATARLASAIDLHVFYYDILRVMLAITHRSNGILGYEYDSSSLGLYSEYNEASQLTAVAVNLALQLPIYRPVLLPLMMQFVGVSGAMEKMIINSASKPTATVFQREVVNNTYNIIFKTYNNELMFKTSNYSFTKEQYAAVADKFLEVLDTKASLDLFVTDIQGYTNNVMNQAVGIIVAVIIVVLIFGLLSVSNSMLFARSIVGPWKRLNALQEATISKFVPKGFLSLMGWKSISQATLGKCLEQDATVVVVKIAEFSKLQANMKDSQQLYDYVNNWLAYVGPYIRSNVGYIDKFSSNLFVAIFQKDKKAIKAALEIQQAMPSFNKTQTCSVTLCITIVSGKTVMGTVGENERMESVSISNTMKTAFKLQRIAKKVNASVLTTKETLSRLPQQKTIQHRYIGNIKMKSEFMGSCDLVEILSFADVLKLKTRDHFSKAVRCMQGSRFQEAMSLFEAMAQANSNDVLAAKYRDLTRQAIIENVKRLTEVNVSQVLQSTNLRFLLEQHCVQEHSAENINLWNLIQTYKDSQYPEQRRVIANRICDEFLNLEGKQAVNLSEEQVAAVKRVVQNSNGVLATFLFADIEAHVEHLMIDTVKRLKGTTQFKLEFLNSSLAFKLEEIQV